MPGNPTLYLGSTIPSYLAVYPSRDLVVAAHQHITREWWDRARPDFDVYISQAVLDEISAGDPNAAARRLVLWMSCIWPAQWSMSWIIYSPGIVPIVRTVG